MERRTESWEGEWTQSHLMSGLYDRELHVWKTGLDEASSGMHQLQQLLSLDELCRAARYHFVRDRRRFVVGRGFLRTLLGLYLDCSAKDVRFRYTRYGRPELAGNMSGRVLAFSLSHSHELVMCAVSPYRNTGVDVEWVERDLDWRQMAQSTFSDREYARICSLSESDGPRAFFRQWTLKEAYSKALGKGLSLPWREFEICVGPREKVQILGGSQKWKLLSFDPAPSYVAAVAVQGVLSRVEWRELPAGWAAARVTQS